MQVPFLVLILLAIPILGILILIHEIGHFWAARWMKVGIEEFGIGMPPRALRLFEKNGVEYTLNWIPFGGFVRMAGEDDPDVGGGLSSAPPWRRLIVLSAGPLMNLVLAFLLFTGLAMAGHMEIVSQQVGVYYVELGSPAQEAGLQPGDLFVSINGRPITSYEELQIETTLQRGHPVTLVIERDGQLITTELVPRKDPPEGQGPIGIRMAYYEAPLEVQYVFEDSPAAAAGLQEGDVVMALDGEPVQDSLQYMRLASAAMGEEVVLNVQRDGQYLELSLFNDPDYEAIPLGLDFMRLAHKSSPLGKGLAEGWRETVDAAALVPRTLAGIFRSSVPVSDISGPVGITYATAQVARAAGLYGILHLSALISVNFFLVNLLPIPALDGGRMAFALLEWVRGGKRISPEREGLLHMVFFLLLMGFLVLVTYYDLVRIFTNGGTP
ncbi:MAG: RIP metalloprotease RseP [Chloroflexia bacterium]|nr:RIP metalloprotease RseP [Chloroflexia bacterium]